MAMWVNVMYYVRRPALLIIITRDGNQWVIRLTKVVFRYCYNHERFMQCLVLTNVNTSTKELYFHQRKNDNLSEVLQSK